MSSELCELVSTTISRSKTAAADADNDAGADDADDDKADTNLANDHLNKSSKQHNATAAANADHDDDVVNASMAAKFDDFAKRDGRTERRTDGRTDTPA